MNNQSLEELKLPLIVADYRTYFDASTRVYDQIAKYRQWEITLITVLSIFLGRYGAENYFLLPILFLIAVFWALDARSRLLLDQISELSIEAEVKLSAHDVRSFKSNIQNWEFGNTSVKRASVAVSARRLIKRMTVKSLVFLHSSLAIFSIFMYFISGNLSIV
ncbi:MAG: hypothetical protein ACKE5M_04185 [Methylophilaceae bacterium]